jgi:hypothetical protein
MSIFTVYLHSVLFCISRVLGHSFTITNDENIIPYRIQVKLCAPQFFINCWLPRCHAPVPHHHDLATFGPPQPLLSLPAEIRLMIWDYVLTDNCIIMRQRGDRLTYEFMLENEAHEIQKIKTRGS